ncbi:hypothetical protein [Pseudolactococcus raffinolactis]|uniref:hypothetical protein n=1 Tax=Pseudolactococcus raffinolactis TaxID=1366 RepID=UPI001436BC49|nr:hypothetical protein [Lactococcus raffinolactis]
MDGKLTVTVDIEGVDEAIRKVKRYVEILKEAKTLADELASVEFEIISNLE